MIQVKIFGALHSERALEKRINTWIESATEENWLESVIDIKYTHTISDIHFYSAIVIYVKDV